MSDDLPEPNWTSGGKAEGPVFGPYEARMRKARTEAEVSELLESLLRTLRRNNAGEMTPGTKKELASAVGHVFDRLLELNAKRALSRAEALLKAEGAQPRELRPLSLKLWVTYAKRALEVTPASPGGSTRR